MEIIEKILKYITYALIGVLILILIFTSIELIVLVCRTLINSLTVFEFNHKPINTKELFIVNVQGFLGGVLLVFIIIELIHSLLVTLDRNKRNDYLMIIIELAIVAVLRHLFIYELDHLNGINIIGIAMLLLVLGFFYLVYKPEILKNISFKKSNNKN